MQFRNFLILISILFFLTNCEKDKLKVREEYIRRSVEQIRADSLESYVRWLENMGTRFLLADNHRRIAVAIKERLIGFGYQETVLDSFSLSIDYGGTTYNTWQYNVMATLPGTDIPDSISIIGSHYDSKLKSGDMFDFVPGASDNASGVAAMLEIARLMHKNSFKPKYSVRFIAFAAEELGLYGSFNSAQKASANNERIIMMLNNDMISNLPVPETRPWYINIIDYENSVKLRKEAESICNTYTSLISFNDNTLSGRSDSYPFYLNGFKPLFFIQQNLGDRYHTVNDIFSACNFEYCREVVKISYAMLLEKNYKEQIP